MTPQQAEQVVLHAGLSIKDFWEYMKGQTMSLNDDGTTNIYDDDVAKFLNGERGLWD